MRVVELIPEIDPVKMARSASGLERSSGTHVTACIRYLENTIFKKGRKPCDELTRDELRRMGLYTSVGWGWEQMLQYGLRQVYYPAQPAIVPVGEISRDGITGTPDGFNTDLVCVEEYKATYRSSRGELDKEFWAWLVQIKAYCLMLDVCEAVLRVFFVNGTGRGGPQYKIFHLTFEQEELDVNWTMLRNAAKSLERGM